MTDMNIVCTHKAGVEFMAGYYEWNVLVGGNLFYTFGDGIAEEIDEDTTREDLEVLAESYLDSMDINLKEEDKETLPVMLRIELKKQMVNTWAYYYGIDR